MRSYVREAKNKFPPRSFAVRKEKTLLERCHDTLGSLLLARRKTEYESVTLGLIAFLEPNKEQGLWQKSLFIITVDAEHFQVFQESTDEENTLNWGEASYKIIGMVEADEPKFACGDEEAQAFFTRDGKAVKAHVSYVDYAQHVHDEIVSAARRVKKEAKRHRRNLTAASAKTMGETGSESTPTTPSVDEGADAAAAAEARAEAKREKLREKRKMQSLRRREAKAASDVCKLEAEGGPTIFRLPMILFARGRASDEEDEGNASRPKLEEVVSDESDNNWEDSPATSDILEAVDGLQELEIVDVDGTNVKGIAEMIVKSNRQVIVTSREDLEV